MTGSDISALDLIIRPLDLEQFEMVLIFTYDQAF